MIAVSVLKRTARSSTRPVVVVDGVVWQPATAGQVCGISSGGYLLFFFFFFGLESDKTN